MILFRYIAKQLLLMWLAVSSVLLIILMFSRFIDYLNKAVSGGIKPAFIFIVMLCRIPGFLEIVFPMAFFLSILIVYGKLYEAHEMVILKSCGVSSAKLLQYTCTAALPALILTALFSMWLTPLGMEKTKQILNLQKSFTALDMVQQGKFETAGQNTYFVETINHKENQFKNIFIAHKNPAKSEYAFSFFTAQQGKVKVENNNRYLVLEKGYRYDLASGQPGGSITQYDDYGILIQSKPLETVTPESTLPSSRLFQMVSAKAIAEWQWRVSLVLILPVTLLIALSLSRTAPRQGRYFNLLSGLLIYLIYLSMLMTLKDFSIRQKFGINFPVLYAVHLLFAFLGYGLFFRDKLKKLFTAGK